MYSNVDIRSAHARTGKFALHTNLMTTRIEHDFLGERHIPANVYYGIQTLRAMENFAITGIPI